MEREPIRLAYAPWLDKEWKHFEPRALLVHRLFGWRRVVAACRIEHFREEVDVPDAGEEDPGAGKDPVHSRIDVALVLERLIPGGSGPFATPPRTTRDRLDRQHGDIPLRADGCNLLERGGIVRVLHHDVAVRKQNGVKVEPFEAPKMGGSDLGAVAGDADEPHQTLIARLETSLQRTVRTQRGVPFDRIGQAVKLDEIHPLDPHAFEGEMNLAFGAVVGALASLGGEEKVLRDTFSATEQFLAPRHRSRPPHRDD